MIAVRVRAGIVLIIVVAHIALLLLLSFRQKAEADGHLFKHLMKEQPLPELKTGTQPTPLPERIDPPKSP